MFRDIERRGGRPNIAGAAVELHNYDGFGHVALRIPIEVANAIAEAAVANGGEIEVGLRFDGRDVRAFAIAARTDDFEFPKVAGADPIHDEPPFPTFGSMRTVR